MQRIDVIDYTSVNCRARQLATQKFPLIWLKSIPGGAVLIYMYICIYGRGGKLLYIDNKKSRHTARLVLANDEPNGQTDQQPEQAARRHFFWQVAAREVWHISLPPRILKNQLAVFFLFLLWRLANHLH